jgi:hypothetical protein
MRISFLGAFATAVLAVVGFAADAAGETIQFGEPDPFPLVAPSADIADGGSPGDFEVVGPSLTWTAFGLTVTGGVDLDGSGAIEAVNAGGDNEFRDVIQDLLPFNAGLGVDFADEEVDLDEIIIFTFDRAWILREGVFRDGGHTPGAFWGPGAEFELVADGVSHGTFNLDAPFGFVDFGDIVGTVFEFHWTPSGGSDFYVHSLTVSPEPMTAALLALGLPGLVIARRKRRIPK